MAKNRTVNGIRYFTCKICGTETAENIYRWKKKKTHQKNICLTCIEKRKLAIEAARERAQDSGYGYILPTDQFHFF